MLARSHNELVHQITQLIAHTKKKLLTSNPFPHVPVFMKALEIECNEELIVIEHFLKEPATLASNIKAHCITRAHNHVSAVPIAFMHNTPTNVFYWELAKLVFQPKTMKQMFKILLPDIWDQVDVSVYEIMSNAPNVELSTRSLDLSADNLEIETLAHYVMTIDTLFDIRQLYKLPTHAQYAVVDALMRKKPKVYASLRTYLNIKSHTNEVLIAETQPETPRDAILRLSLSIYANEAVARPHMSDATHHAVGRFMSFMDAVPEDIGEDIYAGCKFGKDICGKKLAERLDSFARDAHGATDMTLDTPVKMVEPLTKPTPLTGLIRHLVDQPHHITTAIPLLLSTYLIPNFQEKNRHDYAYFASKLANLLRTPLAYYEAILKDEKTFTKQVLLDKISQGYFNRRQITRIIDSLRSSGRLAIDREFHSWLMKLGHPAIIKAALDGVPKYLLPAMLAHLRVIPPRQYTELCEEDYWQQCEDASIDSMIAYQWQLALTSGNNNECIPNSLIKQTAETIKDCHLFVSVLHEMQIIDNPQKILLAMLNNIFRFDKDFAINLAKAIANFYGAKLFTHPTGTWLQRINHVELLTALIPKGQTRSTLAAFLREPDEKNQTILHVTHSKSIIKFVLDGTASRERKAWMLHLDNEKKSALQRKDSQPHIFKTLLESLDKTERFHLLTDNNQEGASLMLDHADNADVIGVMMDSLPNSQRLAAALHTTSADNVTSTFLYFVARKKKENSLRAVLFALAKYERMQAMQGYDAASPHLCAALAITEYPTLVLTAFELTQQHEHDELLVQNRGSAILCSLLPKNTSMARRFLKSISPEKAISSMKSAARHITKMKPAKMKALLDELPNGSKKTELLKKLLLVILSPYFHDPAPAINTVMKSLPKQNRLSTLIQLSQLKGTYFSNSLIAILPHLSLSERHTLLCTRLADKRRLLDTSLAWRSYEGMVKQMMAISSLISDEDSFSIFFVRDNHIHLLELFALSAFNLLHYINFSTRSDSRFSACWYQRIKECHTGSRTFMSDFLIMYSYLYAIHQHTKKPAYCFGLFRADPLGNTLHSFKSCQSVDELKTAMINFLVSIKNSETSEYKDLLTKLVIPSADNVKLSFPSEWNIKKEENKRLGAYKA